MQCLLKYPIFVLYNRMYMKKLSLLLLLFCATQLWSVNLIPLPVEYETLSTIYVPLQPDVRIKSGHSSFQPIAAYLAKGIEQRTGYTPLANKRGKQVISLMVDEEYVPREQGYFLNVSSKKIEIVGHDAQGLFYGVVTLLQTLSKEPNMPEGEVMYGWPTMIADDAPHRTQRALRYALHGKGQSVQDVCKMMDEMASLKLNVLYLVIAKVADDKAGQSILANAFSGDGNRGGTDESVAVNLAEWNVLKQYAADRFILLVPEIEISSVQFDMGLSMNMLLATDAWTHALQLQNMLCSSASDNSFYCSFTEEEHSLPDVVMIYGDKCTIPSMFLGNKSEPYIAQQSMASLAEVLWMDPSMLGYGHFLQRFENYQKEAEK